MRRRLIPFLLVPVLAGAVVACGGDAAQDAPGAPPESTYAGAPAEYHGDGPLLVVAWADWASVWPLTRDAVAGYRAARPDVDVRYTNADDEPALARWLGDVVPTVAVVRAGRIVASQGNVTSADEVAALVAQAASAP